MTEVQNTTEITFQDFKNEVLNDYTIAITSRECSLLGRKEVLTGKAKFGIFGDGKEVPQLALAKAFRNGDFRSGYYRDQTFMMAIGARWFVWSHRYPFRSNERRTSNGRPFCHTFSR
jgi:TPP-dependent pyruvate/acetoin dehydrogenase alpha subunit